MYYKYLFFDLDNTLWDFDSNAKHTLNVLFDKYGLGNHFLHFDAYYQLYKGNNDRLWQLYGAGKITKEQLNQERFAYPLRTFKESLLPVAECMEREYLPLLAQQTRLMPHCLEVLDALKSKRYKLYIISNGFVEIQHLKLQRSGLYSYFDKCYFSEHIGAHKPAKVFFDYAIKSSNALKKQSLVIGDNFEADIMGARNARIDQVYFNPNPSSAPLPFKPTYQITNLRDFLKILDESLNRQ
ncbi:MAG: YjjG family noncanonical pyrimidine nucleotidase [Paludibacteraceae bacterium]|nr:YjjG family noncanonical pyrimidine nucleotidase [Paludibacteraceae bacterium]